MVLIQTTDNNYSRKLTDKEQAARPDIERIANLPIGKLKLDDRPNLLVFPHDLNHYGDDISEDRILELQGDQIITGNIMGFVGVNDTQIDIRSRFAREDENDYFLHYMLQRVFAINLFDIKHSTNKEQVFDFLLYLFPHFLQKALGQGLYKKYRRFEYNDANIRGPIDVSRHIRQNIPFRGTVAYSTREHSYDNEVTQLIRHTIEYIRTKAHGVHILSNSKEMKEAVNQIVMATQTYNVRERQKVINQNLRPIRHPYFSAYTELQKICLQILRHESLKYGQEKDKVYGILFDGAWLWEEYLDTIFEENHLNITHAKNKTGENGIALYVNGKKSYYPDFYMKVEGDTEGEKSFVLDAKYKRLDKGKHKDEQTGGNSISICREDLFQMITYMHVLPAKHCALLYPIEPNEETTNQEKVIKSKERELLGLGGKICGYGLKISQANERKSFWDEMQELEKELNESISDFLKGDNQGAQNSQNG